MGGRLKVFQLIDSLVRDGAEQSLVSLAPHLANNGIDVHVAYLVEPGSLHKDLENAGAHVHSLVTEGAGRRTWFRQTAGLVGRIRPNLVHTTLFEADLAGRRAASRLGVPCVSSLVNTAYGRTESGRDGISRVKLRGAQAADALTARGVARFHAVTRHVATVMGRRLLIPQHKIDVIPRGRDVSQLGRRSAERRATTRQRLDVSPDRPLILAVGRHEPQKGFDVLLRALPKVKAQRPDVQVVVAGRDGRATPLLKEIAGGADISESVTFLGMRDDVADLMAAADVLAFPSLWEGAAGTLLEAMALECPIVSSRLPTLLETVDTSMAELVDPGDADGLARGLLEVLANDSLSAQRVRAARQRFESHYTIDVSAQRIGDLYRRTAIPTRSQEAGKVKRR